MCGQNFIGFVGCEGVIECSGLDTCVEYRQDRTKMLCRKPTPSQQYLDRGIIVLPFYRSKYNIPNRYELSRIIEDAVSLKDSVDILSVEPELRIEVFFGKWMYVVVSFSNMNVGNPFMPLQVKVAWHFIELLEKALLSNSVSQQLEGLGVMPAPLG